MSLLDDVLRANDQYAASFAAGDLAPAPAKHLVVLACMDARQLLEDLLGLELGDAHILRNAGAVVTDDVLRSLVLSTKLMGTTHVVVVGHTGCAINMSNNDRLRARTDTNIDFHAFDDLDAHIREQVETVRSSPILPAGLSVHGFIYQVEDGRLRQVV